VSCCPCTNAPRQGRTHYCIPPISRSTHALHTQERSMQGGPTRSHLLSVRMCVENPNKQTTMSGSKCMRRQAGMLSRQPAPVRASCTAPLTSHCKLLPQARQPGAALGFASACQTSLLSDCALHTHRQHCAQHRLQASQLLASG
jgi:hypothetical protein